MKRKLLSTSEDSRQQQQGQRRGQGQQGGDAFVRSGKGKRQVAQEEARVARLREQQMGFGTALPGSLPSLLQELLQLQLLPPLLPVVLCDIGAGCGNILSDVQDSEVLLPLSLPPPLPRTSTAPPPPPPPRLWGVEMNLAFTSQTPARWRDLIFWCKLEELQGQEGGGAEGSALLRDTTIAYMYDLCLKRLTRKANLKRQQTKKKAAKESSKQENTKARKSSSAAAAVGREEEGEEEEEEEEGEEDPHRLIQRVLLSSAAMPALRYFISTYSPAEMGVEMGMDMDLGLGVDQRRGQQQQQQQQQHEETEGTEGNTNTSTSTNTNTCGTDDSTGTCTGISTSSGNTWRLVMQKKLPCSTDSYLFYVYQRVPIPISFPLSI